MIIKYKRVVSVLIVAAILVLPLAFSVSYAKWTGGANSINVEDVQVGDFYVELTRVADSERQPVLVRSFTVTNSTNIRNYVCIKSIVPDDVELDATNVLAGTLYFECTPEGYKNPNLKSMVVTASGTDAQGKITGNGDNGNVSDLPNISPSGMNANEVYLSSMTGTDGATVKVAFGKGAQQYVALDYNIVLKAATSCTINVYFIQSPDRYFAGTDGASAIDPVTGAHEEINADTWSSAGFWNGIGLWLRGDIGTTEITVKKDMIYRFYFENNEVTSVHATDTPSRGGLFGGSYTNLYNNFEYKANADGNGNGGWVLKAGSNLDSDTIRVKFEMKNGVLVGGYK